jgi:hypothetical protein
MSNIPFDKFEERELSRDKVHWRSSFDSRYLRHFALNGKPRIVTITKVRELVSSNKKSGESKMQLLITLDAFEKDWAINVTNCDIIEMLYSSPNPRDWVGKRIELYPTKTRGPTGQMVDCIRVRDRVPEAGARTEKPKHRQEVAQHLHSMKEAQHKDDLAPLAQALTEDQALTPEERELLYGALKKRSDQLGGAQ